MRTIKFRAWNGREWIYGTYHKDKNEYFMVEELTGSYIRINKDTIGQFVGFLDKNNEEIYEDDIVNTRYGKNTVQWHDTICGFYPFCLSSNAPDPETETEVIGNIHQKFIKIRSC